MAITNETIADIIAAMRGGPIPQHRHDRELLRHYADRIEAANKRERGDCAKLREAIENSNGLLEELAAIGEWGESAREQIAENNAALSAPPRNCDVIGNTGRALAVHGFPTKSKPWGEGEWLKLIDWLFAPYEEGGAK